MFLAEQALKAGVGPLSGILRKNHQTALNTTPVKVADYSASDATRSVSRRVRIKNKHASNMVAYDIVVRGEASTATATASGSVTATDGATIAAGEVEYVTVAGAYDLYVVASASSTPVEITWVTA